VYFLEFQIYFKNLDSFFCTQGNLKEKLLRRKGECGRKGGEMRRRMRSKEKVLVMNQKKETL